MEHDIIEANREHLLKLCLAYEKHGYNEYDLFRSAHAVFKNLRNAYHKGSDQRFIRTGKP